jgi:four helix bundle protein
VSDASSGKRAASFTVSDPTHRKSWPWPQPWPWPWSWPWSWSWSWSGACRAIGPQPGIASLDHARQAPEPVLGDERLDADRIAIELLAAARRLPQGMLRRRAPWANELRRAARSVPLNLAEGASRPRDVAASRHDGIARGAALECGAILEALRVLGLIPADVASTQRAHVVRLV